METGIVLVTSGLVVWAVMLVLMLLSGNARRDGLHLALLLVGAGLFFPGLFL